MTSTADWVIAGAGVATAIATGGAAIAAAVAARRASESTKASVALVDIERQRFLAEEAVRTTAELSFDIEPAKMATFRLVVTNEGPSAAHNVRVRFLDPDNPDVLYRSLQTPAGVEVKHLAPRERITADTIPHSGGVTIGFDASWDDSRGRMERTRVLDRGITQR